MINLKTEEEMKIMAEGGRKLRNVVSALLKKISTGITTNSIDIEAENLIKKEGGESSFKKVKNYFWSTCLTVNEQVVHTPPSKRVLKEGDLLTVDIGMYYRGFHTDFATTIYLGSPDARISKFLESGKKALKDAINQTKAGNRLGDISEAIEKEITGKGYFIMKELTGHGVGRELHEDPYVFGFQQKPKNKTMVIRPGLVIAVEVIYSMGTEEIVYEKENDWSIISADNSLTACFEHTVAITEKKTLVLT